MLTNVFGPDFGAHCPMTLAICGMDCETRTMYGDLSTIEDVAATMIT
jgi:hypothetical protein